tara:strand:+ start:244 stop:513 length:270 start_codon:yes stop_codon:yes gene_type:complete
MSRISGSIAQLEITEVPCAQAAANIAFSVAPTEIEGKIILFPINPFFAVACMYPLFIFILAPNFSRANKWRSTGRVPIAHPPGNETLAL